MRRLVRRCALALVLCLAPTAAFAAATPLNVVPSAWLLQNYIGGGVVVFYTGAAGCAQGALQMPSSSTIDEINRFWSLILTAKASNKLVLVWYESTSCQITSFGFLPQ